MTYINSTYFLCNVESKFQIDKYSERTYFRSDCGFYSDNLFNIIPIDKKVKFH